MPAIGPLAWAFVALVLGRAAVTLSLSRAQSLTVARHREEVPEAFAQVLTVAAHHRAADYTRAKESLSRRAALLDALVLLGWTLGGGLAKLDAASQTLVRAALGTHEQAAVAQGCVLLLGFVALNWLADLPASLWRIFKIEQRFGFNRTTWAVFGKDQLKGALLGALIGLPLWALILVCLRKPHPLAWVGAWGLYATLSLLLVWAGPRLIAPLFNTFRPLDDAAVQARIDGLMARCGYAHGGLFVMDGSARSTHGNAYFTGLGRSKRVVFFDTLLETLTPDEIEGVLAHELGHFALGHITKQLGVSLLGSLLAFGLTASALTQPRLFMAMGLPDASLSARLLALMLLWSLLGFWLTPLWSYVSRRREYQADAYACRVADGEALKRALVKLFVDNGATLTPHPRYTAFYSSHPPAVARLAALAQSQRSTPEVRQPS